MSTVTYPRMRQVVDWSAAVWAGVIAGIIFMLTNLILGPILLGGNIWVYIRLMASILLGEGVVAPPATFSMPALLAGLFVHFGLSIIFTMLLAAIVHRWGMKVSVIVGVLFGLAIYLINFYTFTYFYPWFFPMRSSLMIISHILFGALAGAVYEALEVVEFVPADD